MDRRTLLGGTWKVLVAVLGVQAVWTTWDFLRPRASGGFGADVEVGAVEGVPEGEVRYVAPGRLYVVNVDGRLHALYQKCPHLGCRVPFCESSGRFECPCHASIFNRQGEYISGPSPRGMDGFPVRVVEGNIVVDTGTVMEGPPRGRLTYDEGEPGPSCLTQVEEEHRRPPEQGHDDEPGDHDPHGDEPGQSDDGEHGGDG
ncbi:MAG TPA: Rieske 2Fe-2S domain-containing protein [Acidimicrobiales bacterium]